MSKTGFRLTSQITVAGVLLAMVTACAERGAERFELLRNGISTSFEREQLAKTKQEIEFFLSIIDGLQVENKLFFTGMPYKAVGPDGMTVEILPEKPPGGGAATPESLEQRRAKAFIDLGIREVNRRCDSFFDALSQMQKDTAAIKSGVNITGTAIAGVLSAVQASAKSIALVALGTGFTEEAVGVVKSSVVFALNAEDTQDLVRRFQEKYLRENSLSPNPSTIEAIKYVQDYAVICLPATISGYVAKAVRAANPTTSDGAKGEGGASAMETGIRGAIAALLGYAKPLDDDQVKGLYWLLVLDEGKASGAERERIDALLGDLAPKVNSAGPSAKSQAKGMLVSLAIHRPALEDQASAAKGSDAEKRKTEGAATVRRPQMSLPSTPSPSGTVRQGIRPSLNAFPDVAPGPRP
ncbi:hypothetical protein FBZ83_102125 [Azospirillum brasilense]|uniref:Uncharacterized protein n=1 Tax=Azospirillum brasilense TaxID=192 RepID=A0A560CN83_AZOBR|nr:hypothetical protein [Azospirillum brasilense]TWA86334.1 hypothetical protein FBZ83_102125 [Azospirillum brasilense]